MLFSLVIPTYNERENVVPVIRRVTSVLERVTKDFEIIVVDDNSPDGTWEIAERLEKENRHLKVIRRRGERGLATAVAIGWKVARGEILGVMDGDLQHPPETLAELLNGILEGHADVVVASRHTVGGGVSDWSLIRRLVSWAGAAFATLILPGLLRIVKDPMSGYFIMRRSVIESAQLRPRGYKILLEVLTRGKYQRVVEVPYVFEERKDGGSKLGLKQYLEFGTHLVRLGWDAGEIGRFARFCTVGFSGVLVNEGTLGFLTEVAGLDYRNAGVVAVEMAILSNFVLNECWTFGDRSAPRPGIAERCRRAVKFNVVCAVGGLLNLAVLLALTYLAGWYYLISNVVGIAAAALWNYGVNGNFTWEVPVEREVQEPPRNAESAGALRAEKSACLRGRQLASPDAGASHHRHWSRMIAQAPRLASGRKDKTATHER